MTYSNLLDRYSRPVATAGRSFPTARLPAAVVLAMALNTGAYLSEVFRAGIQGIDMAWV